MKKSIFAKIISVSFLLGCANPRSDDSGKYTNNVDNKRILIVVTSNDKLADGKPAGYYLPEVIRFYNVLHKAGFQMDFASPKGGKAPMYAREYFVTDAATKSQLEETGLLEKLDNTTPIERIAPSDYSTIFYVGGYACLFDFPINQTLANIGARIYENEGIVAAVCHGSAALLNIKLANGRYLIEEKTLTSRTIEEDTDEGVEPIDSVLKSFPFIVEQELIEKGANYSKANPWQPHVEVSERLVTGQGPSSTWGVAIAVVELLTGLDLLTIEELLRITEQKDVSVAIDRYKEEREKHPANFYIEEQALSTVGRKLLENNQNKGAIEVFKLVVSEYPSSWNAHDNLGGAFMENGDKEHAIENYRKSLALNPKNTNAITMINNLQNQ